MSEAIGEDGTGGGGRGTLSGPGVMGGVGGRIDKVGGRIGRAGGRKERLGGLGGGIGFRLEIDFASSLSDMFCCSTEGSLGLYPRLGFSVRWCGFSDLLRPIKFLDCVSRGMGEGRLSAAVDFGSNRGDLTGSHFGLEILSVGSCRGLLWTLFWSDAEDGFLWKETSSVGRGGS